MDNNFTNINETNIFIIILIVEYIAWSDSLDFISMMIGIVVHELTTRLLGISATS
jgi:hypothetical protein